MRGGNRGGGTTVKRIDLSNGAAEELRRRVQVSGSRYRKEEANATANSLLEALANGTAVYLLADDLQAALPYLQAARELCFYDAAQRGLDQLITALWIAKNRQ